MRAGATVDQLTDGMLRCKVVGHAWEEFRPMRRPPRFGALQAWLCMRCASERHDIVSWVDGSVLSREYRYVEGYQLAEKHRRHELRLALLQRGKGRRRRHA